MSTKYQVKSWYLAGPMTGIPQFNFPAFEAAALELRNVGFEIITPHELDTPAVREAAWASPDGKLTDGMVAGETWGDMLARDVKIVSDVVGGVIVLPGWERSRGARLETYVAHLCRKPIVYYTTLTPVPPEALYDAWVFGTQARGEAA